MSGGARLKKIRIRARLRESEQRHPVGIRRSRRAHQRGSLLTGCAEHRSVGMSRDMGGGDGMIR